ncbi:hypothetical protein [Paucibacter sp. Y2R2-4]|uniref:hypothetical protein n=1 Tax=Paucibacter sp. Y2R2-4 TaxID=2893553 RepID=UPI0021E3FBC9|nr:hypothetical protein [Paucibacter sp. Y2R2-4]MCV2352246.1 hypothetical protein [Paucibacter sp. Y2R2-4]
MFGKPQSSSSPNGSLAQSSAADGVLPPNSSLVQDTLDALSHGVQDLREQVGPALHSASDSANSMAHRAADALHERSLRLREQAVRAGENTTHYIREEPVKSVLIAAAGGALLMALFRLLSRARG